MTYLVDISFKTIINQLSHQLFTVLNKNYTDCFKFKYCDHDYDTCRLLYNKCINEINLSYIKSHILDIIVVSCYYSKRYQNSDAYLENCNNKPFVDRVCILKIIRQNLLLKNSF